MKKKGSKKEAKEMRRGAKKKGESRMQLIAIVVGVAVLTLYIVMIAMFHGEGAIVYLSASEVCPASHRHLRE